MQDPAALPQGWHWGGSAQLPLQVPPDVYLPAEDSLLLSAVLTTLPLPAVGPIVEVGCGAGLQALTLAARGASVIATDTNPAAVRCLQRNALRLGLSDRIHVVRCDLLSALAEPAGLIVCNPPYLPSEPQEREDPLSRAWDGGVDGGTQVRRLLAELDRGLRPQGRLVLLLSSLTGIDLAAELPQRTVRVLAREPHFFERLTVYEVA